MNTHRPKYVLCLTRCALAVLLIAALSLQPLSITEASTGTFTVAISGDVVTFDPALATDGTSLLVATQIFDTLLTYEPGSLLPAPGLAERWTISADARTWTLHLRAGITFHDGAPLNANAVVFNLQRWWDPAHPYHQGDFVYFEALFGFRGDPNGLIQAISASGPSVVVIQLTRPNSTMLSSLALPAFSIASPAAIQAGTLATAPVGTGPFRFVRRTAGASVEMAAVADYWRGAPRSSSLVFRVIPSAADRLAALRAGTVQVANDVAGPAGDPELRTLTRTSLNVGYLGINHDHTPLGNLLVRQAIAHAVNKQHLRAVGYAGGGIIADQFLPAGLWGRDPTIEDYEYDPDLARSLLAQAGYTSGITTTLGYRPVVRAYMPDPQAVAQALRTDMAAAGIHLVVNEYDSGTFLGLIYAGQMDLFLLGWSFDFPHPDNFFAPHFMVPAGFGAVDVELSNQLAIARSSPDLAQQDAIYRWASRRVHDTLPVVPIANGSSALTTRFDVAGVAISPIACESYREARVVGAAHANVTPTSGATLTFTDVNHHPTTALVPPAAVSQPTTIQLTETEANSEPLNQHSGRHAIELSASRAGAQLPDFAFSRPVTTTIVYSDLDIVGARENTLALYQWRNGAWQDAAGTCSPPSAYVRDLALNRISVAVCQTGLFALFGMDAPLVYLPWIRR